MRKEEKVPLEGKLAILFTVVMIGLLTLQIVLRYFFGKSIAWMEEVSRYFFVWAVYCYIILAAKDDSHIRITFHLKKLSERTQKIVLSLADSMWLAFNLIVVYVSIQYVVSMFEYPYYSQTLRFNIAYVYMIVPIGFTFLSVRIFQAMVKRIKSHVVIPDQIID